MDASIVPQKRSSSPTPAVGLSAASPSAPKQARLDPPQLAPSSAADGVKRAPRRPKQAALFDEKKKREPGQIRGMEEQLVDSHLEVEDAASYLEALLGVQNVVNRMHHPTRPQIRMLLCLSLFPLLFKPPTKSSNPAFARRNRPTSLAPTDLTPSSADPLDSTHRKIREQALALLQSVVGLNGAEAVCRAVRGNGKVESHAERRQRLLDEEEARRRAEEERLKKEAERAKQIAEGKKVPPIQPVKPQPDPGSDDEEYAPAEEDDVLALAAKRVGRVEDLWDFLAGTTARKARIRTREKPVVEGGGWALLRVLVEGWEEEHERKVREKVPTDPVAPLSLLRYFKPSASSNDAREISSKALDIVFWPFSEAAEAKKASASESEDEDMSDFEGSEDGKKDKQDEEEVEGDDGMELADKREAAVKLLGVMGSSAIDGWLSGSALLSEVVQRMKGLQPDSLAAFIELLHLPTLPFAFSTRLLATYLETGSHPVSRTPDLVPPSLSSALTPSSANTSPRKRALMGAGSFASFSSDLASSTTLSAAQLQASIWRIPPFSSGDFLALIARVPIEVPLDTPAPAVTGARRPKVNLPSSFARPAAAAHAHRLVKEVLLQLVMEKEVMVRDERAGEIRDMLDRVEEKVEAARVRVEGK
ncbi:hypothetical protein JCM10213_008439 [Rhodosporidiobolus nylandii]